MVEWSIIATCLALACVALYGVRRLDDPLVRAIVTTTLGSAGAVGLIALPIANAGGAGVGGVVGAGLLLAAVAAPMFWLWLRSPRGRTRPVYTNETPVAQPAPQPKPRDVRTYRVRSAAEAIAEAGPARSARVRRIMEMEASA